MADSAAQPSEQMITERISVRGMVQGVGFRPTVWRIAQEIGIRGRVLNNGDGVEIIVQGKVAEIEAFITSIKEKKPLLSSISFFDRNVIASPGSYVGFEISRSESTSIRTGVVPDASVCAECLAETLDPFSRRYRYPFTNCMHCGPRFSMIEDIPYDRASTTMRTFETCDDCRVEYEDPADRRFHAQPIACYKCGPKMWIERADGKAFSVDALTMLDAADAVCTLLQRGRIVAIKGIGGFQLACDAANGEAVLRLRSLKHRERKPFALMVRDVDTIRRYCTITPSEQAVLESHAAPIVILERGADCGREFPVSAAVAPGINTLGIMLPNTPLHHLILKRMDRPVVLTSGNLSDEPQSIDNDEAKRRLGAIAEYFVLNDRPIAQRVDDSVVRFIAGERRVLRRARGFAPAPFVMPKGFENVPPILAFGGELKNTFCLLSDGRAIVSQHIGDLENAAAQADYRHNLKLYETLYQHEPTIIACDLHPEYLSAKLARKRADDRGISLVETQHHHAHIAACLAENSVPLDAKPVIGVALDGIGFGDDGKLWGGEFLLADHRSYRRLGTFKPVAMIGGEQAIKEPWRNTFAHLMAEMGWAKFAMNYSELELFAFLNTKPREALDGMVRHQINSPLASSCGRLFDAVAAAVGIAREHAAYEGQGAVELEAAVDEQALKNEHEDLAYPFAIPRLRGSNLPYIEPLAMWQALLGDLILKTPVPVIAARFHKGLAKAVVQMIVKLSEFECGDDPIRTVALSGGVWQNKVLLEEVLRRLKEKDLKVLTHREFPTNDGGLSLGQAVIAAARWIQ